MLTIVVPSSELWDESNKCFISTKETTLVLEHSLVSISKWESKWHKAFLSKKEKTNEEVIDYVRCMTITQNVDPNVYLVLTSKNLEAVNKYISDPMTATYIPEEKNGAPNRDVPTSELIYYWMASMNIPFECQKWHLNRLLMLIQVFNYKNRPKKKHSQQELASKYAAMNAARRKARK